MADSATTAMPADESPPAELSLGDLLEMLPLDVVAANIWQRLHCNSCRGHLRRSCRQLRDLSYHLITTVTQDLRRPTHAASRSGAAVTRSAADVNSAATITSAVATTGAAATSSAADTISAADVTDSLVNSTRALTLAPAPPPSAGDAWQQRMDRQTMFLSRLPRLRTLRLQRWGSEDDLAAALLRCDGALVARVRSLTLFGWPLPSAALQAACSAFSSLTDLQLCRDSHALPAAVDDDALQPLQLLPLQTLDLSCCSLSWGAVRSLACLSRLQRLALELPYTPADELPNLPHQLQPLTALSSSLTCLYAVLRQPRDTMTMVDVAPLFHLSQLTALRLPDVCAAAPGTQLSALADTLALLAGLTRLRSLELSCACQVGDAEFSALQQLSQLTLLAVHSIHVTRPTPGHLPQLDVLLLWHELRPAQMLHTLLPLLPLPALTRMHGFRGTSQLCVNLTTHAAAAHHHSPAKADACGDVWAGIVSGLYASVRPDGKEDSDCDTDSLISLNSNDSSDGDDARIAAGVAASKAGGAAQDGGDAVTRDAKEQAAALRLLSLLLAAAPRLRLQSTALVCRQPHPRIMPPGRPLSFGQIVQAMAPLAGRLDCVTLNSWSLEAADWGALGAGLQRMVTLTLERCDFVAEALAAAVGHLPALERLRLHRCVGVTAEGVQQLVAACPRPVKLHVFPPLVKRPRITGAVLDQMRGLA